MRGANMASGEGLVLNQPLPIVAWSDHPNFVYTRVSHRTEDFRSGSPDVKTAISGARIVPICLPSGVMIQTSAGPLE
jgi:hypothetical protein